MDDDCCEGEEEGADSAGVRLEGFTLEKSIENDRRIGSIWVRRMKRRNCASVRSSGAAQSWKKRVISAAVRLAMIDVFDYANEKSQRKGQK